MESKSKTTSKCPMPVRFCDMMDMAGPESITKCATPKPFRFQPVRMCDMIKEYEESAKKKQARKQLWPNKKENKRMTVTSSVTKRLSTTMKPEKNIRKTMFTKPAIARIVSTVKKTDDTLPLNPKRLSFKTNIKGTTKSTLLPKVVENKTESANKSSIPRKMNHITPPFRFQPVRMCDMIKEYEESAKKKQARKQLWPNKKENKRMTVTSSVTKRLSTTMKPEKNIRKTMFTKPAIARIVSTVKKTDDTLPLNPKRLSFKTNIKGTTKSTLLPKVVENKTESANKSSIPRKMNHITPRENKSQSKTIPRPNKSLLKTNTNSQVDKNKSELKINENILEYFNKKIDEVYNKVDSRISEVIEQLDQLKLASGECKNCGCKTSSTQLNNSTSGNLNNSCYIVEQNPNIILNSSTEVGSGLVTMRTPEVNTLISNALINLELKQKNIFSTNKTKSTVQEIFDSPIDNKIIRTKFEMLESKLKFESPMSDELSLSDTESPMVTKDINWLLNDKDDCKLHKSLSTPSVTSVSIKKSVSFQSKSQNELRDPISMYNDMRSNVKFLCTPKKTTKISNLMTPSVTNNDKKLLSRQIQKQLQMLY